MKMNEFDIIYLRTNTKLHSEKGKYYMTELVFNIVFSILLLPIYFLCSAWMLKEAFSLTDVTFREYINRRYRRETEELEFTDEPPVYTDPEDIELSRKTQNMDASSRELMFFLKEHSSDPKQSLHLINAYSYCSFLGFSAFLLAQYTAISRSPDKLKFALLGNIILLILNLGLLLAGKIYRTKHPIDEMTAEKLRFKHLRENEEKKRVSIRNIIIYCLVGLLFFGGLLYVDFSLAGVFSASHNQTPQSTQVTPQIKINYINVNTVLTKRNFETANIPTTYWYYDEDKLLNVCAGVKDGIKFEYYEYSNSETTDLVYNSITYSVSTDMEPSEREGCETKLPDGNKIFTALIDGVYQLCIYKDNTVVYAYSESGLDEINSILYELGYLQS